jgi:hypothetical protein
VAPGQGAGVNSQAHGGIAVAEGRATAALFRLFVVPVACSLIDDFMELLKRWKRQDLAVRTEKRLPSEKIITAAIKILDIAFNLNY